MNDPENQQPMQLSWKAIVELLSTKYGAVFIGLALLLTLWWGVAMPILERQDKYLMEHNQIVDELKEARLSQREITEHLRTTSEILDRITARLSKE